METKVRKKISTNSRVLSDLLTKYKNTFYALAELITNSIQAKATEIKIEIDYPKKSQLSASPIKSISLVDNGHGVPFSEFESKILEIGTTSKSDGQGIGRFGALQIGSQVEIDTIGWDESIKKFTRVFFPIDTEEFKQRGLKDIDFELTKEIFDKKEQPYYSVLIKSLYHGKQEKTPKKNRIAEELLMENFHLALFEKYPYQIFNNTVSFIVNGKTLKRDEFIYDKPTVKKVDYTGIKGETVKVKLYFYNVRLEPAKVKVFFQVENGDVKTVAHEYTYSSDWHSPDLGSWFIYVESPLFTLDLFRNIDIEEMGDEEFSKIKNFVKGVINDFFISRNQRFKNFTAQLSSDSFNPHKDEKPASETHEAIFQKAAFLVEDQYKLLAKDNKIRSLIYPLIDKAISDGNIREIFEKIIKLDAPTIERFHDLLLKTELENVVHFASQVADHSEFLDFLHELVYGKVAQVLKERSQLHKIIQKHLWIFGEQYNGTISLWSDKKIGNILTEIRNQTLVYEPTDKDENLIPLKEKGLNDITDLFFTNERITDDGSKEYMIVELKAPKCAIGQKEIAQIDKYAFTIEKNDGLPSEKVKYRLLLISSKLNDFARSKMDAQFEQSRIPFLFEKKKKGNIEIYIMSWSDLIEANRRKLSYLSKQLKVRDKSVKEKFETEYSELLSSKVRSTLKRVG
ncbi:MAG: ATP-binding protein [Cytophagales bacterium]|nr:ATP-binding protein [Cytophagales bacterium]MCA6366240.1 ATP-binding protein [Cytophagales bacterium]MCA6371923.1 ATP-binding protein [Cytophagales bacterium]MCA6376631.1 ATP-binding protein [Cytophagales bacterium]MCA6383671.1 ATP-binding protein [Cytophagales bacterium]